MVKLTGRRRTTNRKSVTNVQSATILSCVRKGTEKLINSINAAAVIHSVKEC